MITIIVLLILAGVTVATLTGENGLLSKAQLAKEKNIEAEDDEKDKLSSYENEIDNYGTWERTGTNSGINYSLDEQDTGLKWIDGKPIYQRSLKISNSYTSEVVIDSGTGKSVTGITDIFMSDIKPTLDQVIETTIQTNNGNNKHHQYAHRIDFSNGYVCAYDNYNVGYINFALYPGTVITIKYTKTDTTNAQTGN